MAKQTLTLSNDQVLMINNYLLSEEYWQNKNDSIDGKLSWNIRKNRKEIAISKYRLGEVKRNLLEYGVK